MEQVYVPSDSGVRTSVRVSTRPQKGQFLRACSATDSYPCLAYLRIQIRQGVSSLELRCQHTKNHTKESINILTFCFELLSTHILPSRWLDLKPVCHFQILC